MCHEPGIGEAILRLPATAWTPPYDADGHTRSGEWVAEITGMLNLASWPSGMRVIVRKERSHPGAPALHRPRRAPLHLLRHQHPWRATSRAEDRIRTAKDTGLRNLPLHDFTQKQIWCEIVALACELISWMQLLALNGPARRWEPKRLRLSMFAIAGRLVRGGRRLRLRIAARWPWAPQIITAVTRLQALPAPT
ncbi:transposase [Streptosporangium sp. NPDC049248]|uniref:transposase n=1 Tax=Streptosporangium sp. NPDC049248 TaxID=3155651 RepID=UPI003439BBEE